MSFLSCLPFPLKNWLATIYGFYNYLRKYRGRKRFLKQINSTKNFSREEWISYQSKRLDEILAVARFHVPYYKRYWKNSSLEWKSLDNWPIMSKQTIKGNERDFIDERISQKSLIKMYTSGSSGQPMCYYLSKKTFGLWYALYDERIKSHHGIDITKDAYATFGGRIFISMERNKPPFWMWNSWDRQLYCSSYHMSESNMSYYISALEAKNVRYIIGYVSAIFLLANYIVKNGIQHLLKIKTIITNAEPLYDHQREIIEQAFTCTVVETYSGCEYAFGGNQMFNGEMVLWPEAGILEVLDSNQNIRKSGKGEFLATGLINKAMPLIRFKIGDLGKISDDTVSGFQVLERIEGRVDDVLISENGTPIGRMDHVFKKDFDIVEAQIVQLEKLLVQINLVKGVLYTDATEEAIAQGVKDRLGSSVKVAFNYLEEIPRGANGKFKGVISKL